jgi:fucose permease
MLFVMVSIMTWFPTYFHRVYGLNESDAGMRAGIVMLLALVGAPVGGLLTDRWLRRRVNARPLFAALSALTSGTRLFVAFMFFSGMAQFAVLLVMGITFSSFVPAAAAVTQDVVHPGLRAISYAICVIVQNLLGSSMGPIVIGSLSDAYDIQTALMILPAFLLVAAVLFFAASFFYEKDLNKVEKVTLEIEN